jgi:hypothetical protein
MSSSSSSQRWRCNGCGRVTQGSDLLVAANPFNPFDQSDLLNGCPVCKSAGQFTLLCDEPGCDNKVTCGFLVGLGPEAYRRTCFAHSGQSSKLPMRCRDAS